MPTLESMASELQEELERLYPESQQRLRLHASHGFAVEGLMQLANGLDMSPLELRYRTAIEALASLDRGECDLARSEEHTSELQSLMRISYAVFCLKKKKIVNSQNSKPHILRTTKYEHCFKTNKQNTQ